MNNTIELDQAASDSAGSCSTTRGAGDRQLRSIAYTELATHCTYADAWISINGVVYDITNYITQHPFGDTFRGNLGTECGGLFSSTHLNTNAENWLHNEQYLRKNSIKIIGRLDVTRDHLHRDNGIPYLNRIVYKDTSDDEFWQDVKRSVRAHLRSRGQTVHYTFAEGAGYVLYYGVIYLALSYLAWVKGVMIAALLLGFHMLCAVANISHMATHYGFTRNRWLNFAAEQFFDLGGMSWLEWQIEHQSHHNQPHSSIDQQTNQYDRTLATRIHRYVERKRYHRYQRIYFWAAVSPYLLFRFFGTSLWIYNYRRFVRHPYEGAAHILARAWFLAQVLYCAHVHGYAIALAQVALYSLAYSHAAFILLYNDYEDTHNVLGLSESIDKVHGNASWAEIQVRTSNNWYPTNPLLSFVQFHYGYFNFHIEHHLFPALKPTLLREVSPVVRAVCEKHGISYVSTTFTGVQKSLYRHLEKLGAVHPDERARRAPQAGSVLSRPGNANEVI